MVGVFGFIEKLSCNGNAVGAGAVPGHPNEERAVMAVIGRPPVLRVRHQGMQVLDHGVQIKAFELIGVIKRFTHRVGLRGMLVQDVQLELIRPPVGGRRRATGHGLLACTA